MTDQNSANSGRAAAEVEIVPEVQRAENAARPWVRFVERLRAKMYSHPALRIIFRAVVGTLGGSVLVLGIILVPLPGPGWLVMFVGIAILSVEFPWAKKIYTPFRNWIQRSFAKLHARRERKRRKAQQ